MTRTHPLAVIVYVLLDPHIIVIGVIVCDMDSICTRFAFVGLVLRLGLFLGSVLVVAIFVSATFVLGSRVSLAVVSHRQQRQAR
jgi:hypothetical protein